MGLLAGTRLAHPRVGKGIETGQATVGHGASLESGPGAPGSNGAAHAVRVSCTVTAGLPAEPPEYTPFSGGTSR